MPWFFKASEREKNLADKLRGLKTLRVSKKGGISIDPLEIIGSNNFVEASRLAKRIVDQEY